MTLDQDPQELLSLQDTFNQRVNIDWINAGYAWHRAIWMECAELVEALPWKWWKAGGAVDLPQIQLEVIDILHFLMSWTIVDEMQKNRPGEAHKTMSLLGVWIDGATPSEFSARRVIECAEMVAAAAASKRLAETAYAFQNLCAAVGLTSRQMRRLYIGKNALNTVRNLNGYKQGTYQKTWDGREDNAHLEALMDEQPDLSLDEIVEQLTQRYRALHA